MIQTLVMIGKMFTLQLTALLICSLGMSGATFICIGDYTNDLCSLTSDQSPCPHPGSPLYQDCVSGVCRCTGQGYSPCTCLPSVGECEVTADAAGAMATYAYGNGTIRGNHLYSCNGRHENLELHVIANYESNGLSNGDYHTTGNTRVLIHGRCNRVPIVLVFASYKPVNWILDFADPEVIISKVLLISSFVDRSYISHQHGRVTDIERSDQLPWGYGDDSDAGDTVGLLKYLIGRFGHVTSFSGTLKADKWELKLISEDIALDVTTTDPELEDCWSGEQCNSCKQDYVGAINNIPVCCPDCRVPRFVFVLIECLCQIEQIPDEPCVPNVTDMTNETTTGRDLADTGRDQACWIGEQCAPCEENVIERHNDTLVCCPQCGADGCYCDVILLKDSGPVSTGVSQNASPMLQYVINVCVLIVFRTELFTTASEVMI